MGFFIILIYMGGQWIDPITYGIPEFIHSIFGSIVVCCVIIQIWLALYRCHPNSRFRFFFNWSHRITVFFCFLLLINQSISHLSTGRSEHWSYDHWFTLNRLAHNCCYSFRINSISAPKSISINGTQYSYK